MNTNLRELNVLNGTLSLEGDCKTFTDRPAGAVQRGAINVNYNPLSEYPLFEGFLNSSLPNKNVQMFLQVWMGYCLTGETSEKKLIFNCGKGANGKSVFADLMSRMLETYIEDAPLGSVPFSSLVNDFYGEECNLKPTLARVSMQRFVSAYDYARSKYITEEAIKSLTEGKKLVARRMRSAPFRFVPQFKVMVSAPREPLMRHYFNESICGRILLVPWLETIAESKQDVNLPDKLWKERSGILNWILEGTRIWLEQGLVIPSEVRMARPKGATTFNDILRRS